ncbi:hypothetical protein VPH35_082859 [Triticum aestivum]
MKFRVWLCVRSLGMDGYRVCIHGLGAKTSAWSSVFFAVVRYYHEYTLDSLFCFLDGNLRCTAICYPLFLRFSLLLEEMGKQQQKREKVNSASGMARLTLPLDLFLPSDSPGHRQLPKQYTSVLSAPTAATLRFLSFTFLFTY